jgi:hypothetical protein
LSSSYSTFEFSTASTIYSYNYSADSGLYSNERDPNPQSLFTVVKVEMILSMAAISCKMFYGSLMIY